MNAHDVSNAERNKANTYCNWFKENYMSLKIQSRCYGIMYCTELRMVSYFGQLDVFMVKKNQVNLTNNKIQVIYISFFKNIILAKQFK